MGRVGSRSIGSHTSLRSLVASPAKESKIPSFLRGRRRGRERHENRYVQCEWTQTKNRPVWLAAQVLEFPPSRYHLHSGVVTFCRVRSAFSSTEVTLPLAAEEGFTGILSRSRGRDAVMRNCGIEMEDISEITKEDLCKKRWEVLLSQGRRVFVVGDLNIAPAAVDVWDAKPKFEENQWKGGRSIRLEGSDHAPVYVLLGQLPDLPIHNTPSLAARYVPEVRGQQQTIVSLLSKRKQVSEMELPPLNHEVRIECANGIVKESCSTVDTGFSTSEQETRAHCPGVYVDNENIENSVNILKNKRAKHFSLSSMEKKKKKRNEYSYQCTLTSFFQKGKPNSSTGLGNAMNDFLWDRVDISKENANSSQGTRESCSSGEPPVADVEVNDSQNDESSRNLLSLDETDTSACTQENEKVNAALEWQRIQSLMQRSIPLCRGHGEPCAIRSVKKGGPNLGRGFYVCARSKVIDTCYRISCISYMLFCLVTPVTCDEFELDKGSHSLYQTFPRIACIPRPKYRPEYITGPIDIDESRLGQLSKCPTTFLHMTMGPLFLTPKNKRTQHHLKTKTCDERQHISTVKTVWLNKKTWAELACLTKPCTDSILAVQPNPSHPSMPSHWPSPTQITEKKRRDEMKSV
ncbi:hypothetical protein ACLOJK_000759 [Asimina triloba]